MTTLDQIHDFIDLVSNKNMNGWFSPEEKDMALHRASLWLFEDCYRSYALNQKAQDDLAPFKKSYTFTNSSTPSGVITLPANYQHFLGGWVQAFNNSTQSIVYEGFSILNDDELAYRLGSQLNPVSIIAPVGQWLGQGKIQLWPKVPNAGYLTYLKYPDKPEYVYVMDGRAIVYDSFNSSQLEWDESNINKVVHKALSYLGISIGSGDLVTYAEQVNQQ